MRLAERRRGQRNNISRQSRRNGASLGATASDDLIAGLLFKPAEDRPWLNLGNAAKP
jgi:hypothetical protein